MNIFASDKCPRKSAEALDDKRVIKMILESTQMLCTAINECGGNTPYKSTHVNHPCNVWVRKNFANWTWLCDHALVLCNEYTNRYNKEHKCEKIIMSLLWPSLSYFIPGNLTPFPNCTTFKHINDVHEAYRLYLNEKWKNDKRKPKWTNRSKPEWIDKE